MPSILMGVWAPGVHALVNIHPSTLRKNIHFAVCQCYLHENFLNNKVAEVWQK